MKLGWGSQVLGFGGAPGRAGQPCTLSHPHLPSELSHHPTPTSQTPNPHFLSPGSVSYPHPSPSA